MGLSNDLISQFVKVTKDNTKQKTESTVYGETVYYKGETYVKLDGSELLTPVKSTTDTIPGDRVAVMIKDHTATITGNLSSPSARKSQVDGIGNKISEFEIVIADKVSTKELDAERGRIDDLISDNVFIKETLTAHDANITNLTTDNATINEKLDANEADISKLKTDKLDAEYASLNYAKIDALNATDAKIGTLQGDVGEFKNLTTTNFTAVNGLIDDLEANKLSAKDAELKYVNIDWSNIGKADIGEFFAKSGIIENVTVGDATITGNLVGITISGDLIEGNTIVAEKLVIKGEDGLYYKLNTDGVKTETEQTDYNSINGTVIKAKSITATKIDVKDLVAFDATIGGFKITNNAIYSGVKETVDNTTRGIYLDNDGQIAFGDTNNYIKYYRDQNGDYKLEITAENILFGSEKKTVETVVNENIGTAVTENLGNYYTKGETEAAINLSANTITSTVSSTYATKTELSTVEQTTEGISVRLTTAEGNINTANLNASNALSASNAAQAAVNDASKVATNYLSFNGNGLVIGDMTANTLGNNVLIDSDSLDIRQGTTVLASYGPEYIYIGKSNRKATIDLADGVARLYNEDNTNKDFSRFVIEADHSIKLNTKHGIFENVYYVNDSEASEATIHMETLLPWDPESTQTVPVITLSATNYDSNVTFYHSSYIQVESKGITINSDRGGDETSNIHLSGNQTYINTGMLEISASQPIFIHDNLAFPTTGKLFAWANDRIGYIPVFEGVSSSGNTVINYGGYLNKCGSTNIYGTDILLYSANAGDSGYRPYFRAGDVITANLIHTAGYVSTKGTTVYFTIPLTRYVLGDPTITFTSTTGFMIRQNGKYTHGSDTGKYVKPKSVEVTVNSFGIRVNAVFSNTTNAVNNAPCGIAWSGNITFS